MELYDREGNKYTYDLNSPIGEGTNASIFKIDDRRCLKVSKGFLDKRTFCCYDYFDQDMYSLLKSLSLPGLVKLGIPFYYNNEIVAYIMEYYKRSKASILDMPIDYTLDSINELYKDILILSKNNISMTDLYYKNVIVGDDRIKIIDFDSYEINKVFSHTLYFNTWGLYYSFMGLYKDALINRGYKLDTDMIDNMTIEDYLSDYLFPFEDERVNPSLVLEPKLKKVKRPIDLFKKRS